MSSPHVARPGARIALGLGLAVAAAALAAWNGGFGARTGGQDLFAMYLSKHRYIAETLRAGRFPLWNPYEFCGLPLHGTGQGSALYAPLVAANLLLPPWPAMQVIYDLHVAAMVLLVMYYLAGHGIGLAGAATAASIATTSVFNGPAHAGIDHPHFLLSITWVPAMLIAWDGVAAGRRCAVPILALLVAIQWLPGYPEFPLVTAVLLAVVAVLGRGGGPARRAALVIASVALGALIAAVHILPLLETLHESSRAVAAPLHQRMLRMFAVGGPAALAATAFARMGAGAVFLVLYGMLTAAPLRRAWTGALVWTIFSMNWPFFLLYAVWPFTALRFPYSWSHLAPVFAGCLAGLAVDRLARGADASWRGPAIAAGLAGLATWIGDWFAAGSALACALATWRPPRRGWGVAVPIVLTGLHGARVMLGVGTTGQFEPPDLSALAPRVAVLRELTAGGWPRVVAAKELDAGLLLAERLPSPAGYEPALPPYRVGRLLADAGLDRLPGLAVRRTVWPLLAAKPGIASALGIGVVVLPIGDAPPLVAAGYRELRRMPDGDVVLARPPPPRFGLPPRVISARDEEEVFRLVAAPDFDPTTTAVVAGPSPVSLDSSVAAGTVSLIDELPEHIRLRADLARPALLVVRDAWFPGWEARVDGSAASLLRVDWAFRGVPLPAGEHAVELVYRPLSFRVGAVLSVLGLVLGAVLCVVRVPVSSAPR